MPVSVFQTATGVEERV